MLRYRLKDSKWDKESVLCFPFLNKLIPESLIIPVYFPDDERVGLIFRQSALFVDDIDIVEHELLYNYATTWLKDFLQCKYSEIEGRFEDLKINEDQCYFLVHRSTVERLQNLESSIKSFLFGNFLLIENDKDSIECLEIEEYLRDHLKTTRLKIHPVINTEATKYLLDECIPEIQKSKDPLRQFLVLYQYFEVLMEIAFDPKLQHLYDQYTGRAISKNVFRQNVSDLSKESSLINELLRSIKKDSFEIFTRNDINEYFGGKMFSSSSEFLYSIRNEIFHRTRRFLRAEILIRKCNIAIIGCIYECVRSDLFKVA